MEASDDIVFSCFLVCVRARVCVCVNLDTGTYPHMRTYRHTYIHTYLPTYIHTYIHTWEFEQIAAENCVSNIESHIMTRAPTIVNGLLPTQRKPKFQTSSPNIVELRNIP